MTPLRYLMVSSALSTAQLAADILDHGRRYGATRGSLSGAKLRHYDNGKLPAPPWLLKIAYELATQRGWPIGSPEEIAFAIGAFRALNPAATLGEFRARHAAQLADGPDVERLWRASVQREGN